ncbi:MAG: hypothetical protein WAW62_02280 [Candidatus Saccharimonas aalborgensis]
MSLFDSCQLLSRKASEMNSIPFEIYISGLMVGLLLWLIVRAVFRYELLRGTRFPVGVAGWTLGGWLGGELFHHQHQLAGDFWWALGACSAFWLLNRNSHPLRPPNNIEV